MLPDCQPVKIIYEEIHCYTWDMISDKRGLEK